MAVCTCTVPDMSPLGRTFFILFSLSMVAAMTIFIRGHGRLRSGWRRPVVLLLYGLSALALVGGVIIGIRD